MPVVSALGIGLLVGLERERKKDRKSDSSTIAGLRTFTITSLLGYAAMTTGDIILLAAVLIGMTALLTAISLRAPAGSPGLTTEAALMLVLVLGGFSVRSPSMAVALGVVLTLLLAYRERLHNFARTQLTEQEVRDGLMLAAAALVILPMVPDRPVGPYDAVNLRTLWKLTVLLMAISAAGHIAIRTVGARLGLAIAGFVSGFASSTATVASMGGRVRENPALLWPAVTGSMMSTVTTMVLMGLVVSTVSTATLSLLLPALAMAGATATAFSLFSYMRMPHGGPAGEMALGRAFNLRSALLLTATIGLFLLLSALLFAWFGDRGVLVGAAIGGFADTHAAAGSVAALVQSRQLAPEAAVLPILCGLSTNTVSKCVVAWLSGGSAFALRVLPGLLLTMAALWLPLLYR
jgi:uncharacterized membrane protein (DUF4010 family)